MMICSLLENYMADLTFSKLILFVLEVVRRGNKKIIEISIFRPVIFFSHLFDKKMQKKGKTAYFKLTRVFCLIVSSMDFVGLSKRAAI